MYDRFEMFTALPTISILDALKIIDRNCKGFLIVTDENGIVYGTLTDGDIRRALITGRSVSDSIDTVYVRSFISLDIRGDVMDAIDLFKNKAIRFLPVLDEDHRLANIITKTQLHALLLQDIRAGLDYDFLSLDEQITDYEIFHKPWGFYKTTVYNRYFQSKVISLLPGAQLSLQAHRHREEYWIAVHGNGIVQIGDSILDIRCGSSLFIPKGCRHRLTNTSERETLIVTEVQIGDYLGEDDIIRYEDRYGRM